MLPYRDLFAEQALWPNIIMLFQQAFNVLQEAGCSDEALCYEMWVPEITKFIKEHC